MKIPKVDEYWRIGDGKLVKILKVDIRSSNGRWGALCEVIPTRKKRLIRDRINQNSILISVNLQKKNLAIKQETDSRKILQAYLGKEYED